MDSGYFEHVAGLEFDPHLGLFDIFHKRCEDMPDATAVILDTQEISYRELHASARQLSARLILAGVQPGDRVGILAERGLEAITAIVGTAGTRAAYVPLVPSYHQGQIGFIAGDVAPSVLLFANGLEDEARRIAPEDCTVLAISQPTDVADDVAFEPSMGDDVACILYTSGSTGKPKGVELLHKGLARLGYDQTVTLFDRGERLLHSSTLAADLAAAEIWGPLNVGGTIVVMEETRVSIDAIARCIDAHKVDVATFYTGIFHLIVESRPEVLSGLRLVSSGGDALSAPHVERVMRACPGTQVCNMYGPTETSVYTHLHIVQPEDIAAGVVPLGKAVGHTECLVLDPDLQEVPDNTPGQCVIAGHGVARGYFMRPDLSGAAFVDDPRPGRGGKVYLTGDLVVRDTNGIVHFRGRADRQVKLGGRRIELDEIEATLRHMEIVDNAAVATVKDATDELQIIAFLKRAPDAPVSDTAFLKDLGNLLAAELPEALIPRVMRVCDEFPLTGNGKVDRKRLLKDYEAEAAAMATNEATRLRADISLDTPFASPQGASETAIAEIWCELLGLDSVGRNDRFFDLGGRSFLAMQCLERIQAKLGTAISVAEFFDTPTVSGLAYAADATLQDRVRVRHVERDVERDDRIAIVGLGGRFPGAGDIPSFWEMLASGRSGRVDITREDLIAAGEDPALLDDPDYVASAYPLDDAEDFDAEFFGFTPREAQLMDPQQRVLLEAAWTALEDSGYDPRTGTDRIGVFCGVGRNAYMLHNLMSHPLLRETAHEYNMLIGNERDFPATHISFRLGLKGPGINVQSACSTSGVAIHLAAESLRRRECDVALAGGAKILVPNRVGYRYTEGGPLSADGVVRAFDAEARGMVRGSGAAMLAFKRLDDAIRDRDNIYAVLIGSAVNNDGDVKAGFTAPSATGQANVIAQALRNADADPSSISLIEAHGTGTILGDPIEVAGLTRAFATSEERESPCYLGSVKTNIGHLDAGATAAGLIKVALSLKNETIPASLNFNEANPKIGFCNTPFQVADKTMDWPRSDSPRRAGVSSFGLGGTNAHLVIEEAPVPREMMSVQSGPELILVSARTDKALEDSADQLADWLERESTVRFSDVAHTLRAGRRRFEKRLAFLAEDREQAVTLLRGRDPAQMLRTSTAAPDAPLAFLFPGGGAQYAGMARDLYEQDPSFRATLDECDAIYAAQTGGSLFDIIFRDAPIETPREALPSLFSVELAMARRALELGLTPSLLLGHSMGEYTAACVAGVMSLEDAMKIVLCRGRLFETLRPGAMLSVPLAADDLDLGEHLSVAAINRPDQCVVAGDSESIRALADDLAGRGTDCKQVHINVAAHSVLVEPILTEFRSAFESIALSAPKIPIVSNVTGEILTDAEAIDPDYWVRHLRSTVMFAKGLECVFARQNGLLLEIGPGQTLSAFARHHAGRTRDHEVIATMRHPKETADDYRVFLSALGRIWRAGGPVDWSAFDGGRSKRVSLPTYPFQRKRHWIDAVPFTETTAPEPTQDRHAELTTPEPDHDTDTPVEAAAEPLSNQESIRLKLRDILSQLSGFPAEEIDPYATFLELGFDSLFLTQANAAFKRAFKVRLTTRQLIEATPTLDALATHLETEGIAVTTSPEPATATASDATPAPGIDGEADTAAVESPGLAKVSKGAGPTLTADQDAHIDALIAETNRRTPSAKEQTQSARGVLADPRTVQGFRSRWKEMVYPILSDRAQGSRVWDVDGNEYVDLVSGYGVTFLGHGHPLVIEAVKRQIDRTLAIGPQTVLAGETAELVSQLTGMERVAFCNTGSEAVLAAVRIARTVTGRSKIVKFDGHYHGIFDEMQVRGSGQSGQLRTLPAAPGIPREAIQNTIVVKYGDPSALDVIRDNADEIACVLVEPVRSRNPDFQPREYLQELRRVTEESDVPLVFDEIVTGFRSHPGGAQALFDVRADMATYGKVAGGGLPIGIVTGKAQFMDALDGGMWEFGDESVPEADMTWFAGTFVRHPMALAATKATLTHLIAEGPALQEQLNSRSAAFADRLNALFTRLSAPLHMEQFASVLRLTFTEHQEYADLLFFHLRNRGIMTYEGRPIFLTTAHTDADLDKVYDAFADSLRALIAVGLVDGTDPDLTRRIPMATGQQEIWVTAQFSREAACSYNLCSTLELTGALDADAVHKAYDDLVARHEALRTLPDRDGEMQTVFARVEAPYDYVDLAPLSGPDRAERLAALELDEVTVPFDFDTGPLVRAKLIRLGEDRHKVLLTAHHVIADGWSCGVLLRELGQLYAAHAAGEVPNLPPAQQLGDFVAFQTSEDQQSAREAARQYWLDLHKDGVKTPDFPSDRPRPPVRDVTARRLSIMLPRELSAALRQAAQDTRTTLFTTLIGGFAAYVSRLTGEKDAAFGFSAAGQPLLGGRSLVGHCVNFLPLRLTAEPDDGFAAHLKRISGSILDALDNQNFDFVSFVREANAQRTTDWAPIITIGVNLDPSSKAMAFGDLQVRPGSVGRAYENLDLFLNFVDTEIDLELQCTYNAALFDEDTIARRMNEYLCLMEQGSKENERPLRAIGFISEEDRALLDANAREPRANLPATITDAFGAATAAHDDAPALVDVLSAAPVSMSYSGLDAASDTWAAALSDAGVAKGDRVILWMARSFDYVAAILGVLKLGAVYVPLDSSTPAERVAFVAEDCQAHHIVVAGATVAGDVPDGLTVLTPADAARAISPVSPTHITPQDPAYIMYTSGSTGTPKGVVVTHHGIVSLAHAPEYARLDETRTVAQLAPLGFDASTFEIWGALLNGARLAIFAGDSVPSISQLRDGLSESGVTTLWLTAGLFNAIVDEDPHFFRPLSQVLTGGQALSTAHMRKAQAACPMTDFVNGYGPTECTTFACTHAVPRPLSAQATSVPIGRPLAGMQARVVDANLATLPIGVPGELVLGGDGVSPGYWNRPELADTAFVVDPSEPAQRLYRTGDICRVLADGTIDYLRRKDDQVKISGYRIEPREIETCLTSLDGVDSAAVIAAGEPGSLRLVAFVTVAIQQMSAETIRDKLRMRVPRHLLPAEIRVLDEIPVTANGKTDVKALEKSAARPQPSTRATTPCTDTEHRILALWREILGTPVESVTVSFFDLGGHSLLALRLFDRLERAFDVSLPISTLFSHPTVADLAALIDSLSTGHDAREMAVDTWSPAVVLAPGPQNGKAALFIVGGVGGTLNHLADVAQAFGQSRPVIGFEARGVAGHVPHESVEDMAEENLRFLMQHQPTGPYVIGGYSAGVYVAFEMARQLRLRGETVDRLVLLEALAPGTVPDEGTVNVSDAADQPSLRARVAYEFGQTASGGRAYLGPRLRHVTRRFKEERWIKPRLRKESEAFRNSETTAAAVLDAAARYGGGHYDSEVILAVSTPSGLAEYRMHQDNPLLGWDKFVERGRIERVCVHASHRDMILDPNVRVLLDFIEPRLTV
ncbi:hybrid non-ribosomal peptide synthetase/type I polyketide synthase [Tropicimonas marinistellae]|uniref:hybrid non-ribosomal peptide synthetase/type I polyketide synthase n=1 Tax=Tropicimonas marinistellae TaxID=1739787 RepID=UPI00082C3672|nr:hybrid non-ribosomal peptide synthetase/type I polyketide synthase [Tropicimonas marinistellae]